MGTIKDNSFPNLRVYLKPFRLQSLANIGGQNDENRVSQGLYTATKTRNPQKNTLPDNSSPYVGSKALSRFLSDPIVMRVPFFLLFRF